ncbi:MAG: TlyA family RNA methyltransferase [Candidatus Methylomirabilales bacterium]
MGRSRLDQYLVEQGLVESRARAQGIILAGQVWVDGQRVDKPGTLIIPGVAVRIVGPEHPFVSRGGVKLQAALDTFRIVVRNKVCLDVGAGTGGFTDCLLQGGAARVFSLDVGHGRFHQRLRDDPRVVLLERVNVRFLTPDLLPSLPDLVVIDVAFISLTLVLPMIATVLSPDGGIVALIKPQFEVRKGEVGRGGVVRDPRKHAAAIRRVADTACRLGMRVRGLCASPIMGVKGNREFFIHVVRGGVVGADVDRVERLIGETVESVGESAKRAHQGGDGTV